MKQKYFYLFLSLIFAVFGYSQQGTHLNFDGNNDLVNCGNDSSVQITGNQITLEAWIRAESFKPNVWEGTIINKEQNMPDNGYMLRVGASGQANFNIGNGSWHEITTPSNTLSTNTWYHLAATYDGTTMILYVDGTIVTSSTSFTGTISNSTTNLLIGNIENLSRGFDGDIDEVRIWNIARTQTEIQNNMNCVANSSSGLVAYYKFNQGVSGGNNASLTSLTDETINGNHGLLSGFALNGTSSNWVSGSNVTTLTTPTAISPVVYQIGASASALTATSGETGLLWYTTATGGSGTTTAPTPSTASLGSTSYWVSSTNANGCESNRVEIVVQVNPVPPGSYLNFDGLNDGVSLGNTITTSLNGANFVTAEAWIYLPNTTGTKTIVGNHITTTQFNLRVINNQLNAFLGFGTYDLSSPIGSIVANTWQHVAMVYNDTTLKLYINGSEVASAAIPGAYALQSSTQPYMIGFSGFGGEYFNGSIDEVRIWNIAKTETELNNSKDCELSGTESGLIAYYQFNEGIDQANNSTVTSLPDVTSNGYNGTLNNFALNGATSNWLAGSPINTPEVPTVSTPVIYTEGETASSLTATSGGIGLLWYTTSTGGTGSTTAPTPSTATVGNTSYWVSSTNANGCESERVEIVVQVNEITNDVCDDAIALTVGASFNDFPENVDLTGFTDSGEPSPWCGDYQGGDQWFTVTIPASGNLIIETNGAGMYDTGLALYDGDCSNLFLLDCDDNSGNNDYSKFSIYGGPPGYLLYVRVWENFWGNSNAQFQIAAYEPYYNICADTTPITVGTTFTDFPENVNLTGAIDSGVPEPNCANYSGGDQWFAVTIPSNGNLTIETDGLNGDDTGLAAYLGDCDNDLIEIDCNDDFNNGYSLLEFTGLPAGETLYVRVWEYGEGNSTAQFQISAYDNTPPYDICSSTTALTVGTAFTDFPLTADLTSATDSGVPDPGCASYDGGDLWFTAVVPASGNIIVETGGTNGDDTGLAVYNGNCNNGLFLLDCNDDTNGGYSMVVLNNLTPGETLYIRVWQYNNGVSTIQFEVAAYEPYYNICSDTTPITVGAVFTDSPLAVDLTGSTDSGVPDPGCASYYFADQWFTAVVPASGNITIETDSPNGDDTGLAVYNGNCDNGLVLIDCDDDSGNGTYSMLTLTGLTPGETLYIRAWEYDNDTPTIQFDIAAYDASLSNDTFSTNALSIYPNPSKGVFNIDTKEDLEVKVYDLIGKLIYTNKLAMGSNQIDISNYSSGIYLLQYTSKNGNTNSIKLVKN